MLVFLVARNVIVVMLVMVVHGSDCGVYKSRGMVIVVVEVEGSEPEQDNVGTH